MPPHHPTSPVPPTPSPVHVPTLLADYPGLPFEALLTITELDEHGKPGLHWQAHGLRRSDLHVVFRCRRLLHPGRTVVMASHLVDDAPEPLAGCVLECVPGGERHHGVVVRLDKVPEHPAVAEWLASLWPVRPGSRRLRGSGS
ncbi:MAG: hypothetical protein WCK33_08515 [Phycisphaerae bacterium]